MPVWTLQDFAAASVDWRRELFKREGSQEITYPVVIRFYEGFAIRAEFIKRDLLQEFEQGPRCPDLRGGMRAANTLTVKMHDAGGYRWEQLTMRRPPPC